MLETDTLILKCQLHKQMKNERKKNVRDMFMSIWDDKDAYGWMQS